MILRGLSALADRSASIHERRKRSGAAGRIATAGAKLMTFRSAVRTPSDAAARLIAVPATADHGVSSNARTGRRKKP